MHQPNFYLNATEPTSYTGQPISQITDTIWIGSLADLGQPARLHNAGITALLCVAEDIKPPLGWPDFVADHVGLVDGPNPPEVYDAAVLALHALLEKGHVVLVYCHEGVSRSPAVVARYLDSTDPKGFDYWLAFIEGRRHINPHEAHRPSGPALAELSPLAPSQPEQAPAVFVEQADDPVVVNVDVKLKWGDGKVTLVNYSPKQFETLPV